MRKFGYGMLALLLIAMACNKENTIEPIVDEAPATIDIIYASVSDQVTKTDYAFDEVNQKFIFSWVAQDKIKVQSIGVNSNAGKFDGNRYVANESAASTTFTGSFTGDWERGRYAFYPKEQPSYEYNATFGMYGGTNDLFYLNKEVNSMTEEQAISTSASNATVGLNTIIVEVPGKPMAHIPMIGYETSSDNYEFKAATGVLAVTIKNLPSAAKSISLSSTNYALSGKFVFDKNFEIKETYCKDETKSCTKTIEFTKSSDSNRTFYFPIPTGTLPGFTITIKDMEGQIIMTKGTTMNNTIARGKVTLIPNLSFVPSVSWYSLGTGSYNDSYLMTDIFYNTPLANGNYMSDNVYGAVDTKFYQNASNPNVYRIKNPYSIAKSERNYYQTQTEGRTVDLIEDEYLIVQVLNKDESFPYAPNTSTPRTADFDGEVWFGSGTTTEAVGNGTSKGVFSTGLYIDWGATTTGSASGSNQYGEYILMHENWHSSTAPYHYSKVISMQENTNIPATIQLSPYYKTRISNTFTNFSNRSSYQNGTIQITFPVR